MVEIMEKSVQRPIMLDVVGTILNEEDIRRIQHPLTGGVILFARNYENRAQLSDLTQAIHALRPDVMIAVDHEGGRVQRFKEDGFTRLPAMRKIGQIWAQDPLQATKMAMAVGYILAAELRACGVDLSFTPVLDLDYGYSTVIGDRAFHASAEVVALLAQNLNHGLALAGMANCGKHFPGHGFVEADSHIDVPVDERSLSEILAQDVVPYGALGIGLSAVMPAHVVYPKVDAQPAGFSKRWLTILREDLAFDGVVFSDDLSMQGARVAGTVVQGAQSALDAGCDMVLICNSPDQADDLLRELNLPTGAKASASARRLAAMLPVIPTLSWDALQDDARYQAAQKTLARLMD